MYGDTMGVLRVRWAVGGGGFVGLQYYIGDKGDMWIDAAVTIPSDNDVRVGIVLMILYSIQFLQVQITYIEIYF